MSDKPTEELKTISPEPEQPPEEERKTTIHRDPYVKIK